VREAGDRVLEATRGDAALGMAQEDARTIQLLATDGVVMTPLRQRLIEDMPLRGLAPLTQRAALQVI
jgi:hypothetical protein